MRERLVYVVVILVLGFASWQAMEVAAARREECRRMQANQRALLGEVEHYRVRDSLSVASVRVLTLRAAEAEGHLGRMAALVGDMGIRLRRVESLSENVLENRTAVRTPLRDTVILSETVPLVRYDDGHVKLSGIIRGGEFLGEIRSRDTLTQVVHRIPRKFLFIRYGTRELRQEIVSSNPNSTIVYSRFLRVEG